MPAVPAVLATAFRAPGDPGWDEAREPRTVPAATLAPWTAGSRALGIPPGDVLADQPAVAVTDARLAVSLERARLARDLHDSVSQALFAMTMHARAAQLAVGRAGLEENGPLGRAVAQLADLAQGAMAEMRALIFELRPAALAEEGLVAALRQQAAALTAREGLAITVNGPEERFELGIGTEEHLYRIVLEALHNVVKHASAGRVGVRVAARMGILQVVVSDDGTGFDPDVGTAAGHFGLSTMASRAQAIGAALTVTSAPGAGTTVAVMLPAHPDVHVAAAIGLVAGGSGRGAG
jgi:signal transduction histidine kinase